MITVKAHFDGRVFVPEGPVNLPVGHVLEIPIVPPSAPAGSEPPLSNLADALDRMPINPDWPPDGAAQHDHYLYGTPKRS